MTTVKLTEVTHSYTEKLVVLLNEFSPVCSSVIPGVSHQRVFPLLLCQHGFKVRSVYVRL